MPKSKCLQRTPLIASSLCILISLALIFISSIVLPSILKSSIEQELKMVPDTYEYWGQSPGKTNSVTQRTFTFFNFTNPRQFLYQNKTPVFHQITGYLMQQKFNFTDYKYSDDQSEVFFNDWLYFSQLDNSRNLNQPLHVVNVAPLGFWYQLDKVGWPTFALQGFGGLYVELSQTFKTQAIGQGVSSQFLPNYTNWKSVCDNNQIPELQCNNTWQDPQHGLFDQNNLQIWVQFAYLDEYGAGTYLKNYFGFSDLQMNSLKSIFFEWSDTLNQILNNWFCDQKDCTSDDLTLLQLSSGEVTSNPPSGDKVDSICDTGNVTCIGQPQISKFLKNAFKKNHPEQKYQKLKFSIQTFRNLFTSYKGTLLNIGHLTTLFQAGYNYDKSKSLDDKQKYISQIKVQTHAQSNDHAFVIWQWVKEFTSQFVLKLGKGGSQKNAGIGGVFSQALYQSFSDFGSWVFEQYVNIFAAQAIPDCKTFVKQIISKITDQKVQQICSLVTQVQSNQVKSGYSTLLSPCMDTIEAKQKFRIKNKLTIQQFGEYCDVEDKSFYTVAMSIHQKIFNHYSCSPKKGVKICSQYELSLKQFINSTITLNPIANTIKKFNKTLTGKTWNSDLGQFQYKNFLKQAFGNQELDNQLFKQHQLVDLLSFDKLFSAPMVMQLMLQNNQTNFQKLYYWKNMTLLKTFIKFVTIQVGFGGFTQKRTPNELLFGYEDPFLKTLQETDTMMGGDPSINPIVMLNQPNITVEQASQFPQSVFTGESDIALTRQYNTLFGYNYITYNKTWYDGFQIQSQFVSPYKKQVKVKGSDAIQNPPGLDQKSSVFCLITNIYRTAQLEFKENTEMFGVDILEFRASKNFLASEAEYPANSVYYQKFNGFHNLSFLGVPLQISKNNFYECPKNWSELVTVLDEKGVNNIQASIQDDTVLKIQPNTGALFFATVRLQTNYHFQKDNLFDSSDRMLPVVNVVREGAIGQSTVDQLFGDLKSALFIQKALLISAAVIIPLSFIVLAYSCYRSTKSKQQKGQINESLIDIKQQSLITEQSVVGLNSNKVLKKQQGKSRSQKQLTKTIQQEQIDSQKQEQNIPIRLQQGLNSNTVVNINQTVVNQSIAFSRSQRSQKSQ